MPNPNDEIRQTILQYFYDRNAHATSHQGKKGSAVKIADVKRELKAQAGLTQPQVISNLTYLIDRGWVKTSVVEKTVVVRGGTIPSPVTWYEITAAGIDKIEGESEFQMTEKYAGINIQANGNNVITLGDGNVVNTKYSKLHQQLDDLKRAVAASESLADSDKLEVAVDIESLKDQLAKPRPSPSVVRALWGGIETIVTGAEFAAVVAMIAPQVAHLLNN